MMRLFLRGFGIVSLTAANVREISQGHYGAAFVVGTAISLVWWFNSKSASRSDSWRDSLVYALGAGAGTVTGMFLSGLWR